MYKRRATAATQRSSKSPPKNHYSPDGGGTLNLNKDSARGNGDLDFNFQNENSLIGRTIETEFYEDDDT